MSHSDKLANELRQFEKDVGPNGISLVCNLLVTLLRAKTLSATDLSRKFIFLPNNAAMTNWKNRANLVSVVKAHVCSPPRSIETDKTQVASLTRTWSLPITLKSVNSKALIIPVVLSSISDSSKVSHSKTSSKRKSKSKRKISKK